MRLSSPAAIAFPPRFRLLSGQAREARRSAAFSRLRTRSLLGFLLLYAAIAYRAAVALRAPPGVYSAREHASRVAPALFGPIVFLALRRAADGLDEALAARTRRKLSRLEKRKLSLIEDLKDSSRFERTFAILKKYDPAWVQREMRKAGADAANEWGTPAAGRKTRGGARGAARAAGAWPGTAPAGGAPLQLEAAPSAAAPGSRLLPLLSSALSRAATSLIADDPTALEMLREAQEEAAGLRAEVERRGQRLEAARVEIDRLRAELGWPSLEEEEEERQKELFEDAHRGALVLHAAAHPGEDEEPDKGEGEEEERGEEKAAVGESQREGRGAALDASASPSAVAPTRPEPTTPRASGESGRDAPGPAGETGRGDAPPREPEAEASASLPSPPAPPRGSEAAAKARPVEAKEDDEGWESVEGTGAGETAFAKKDV